MLFKPQLLTIDPDFYILVHTKKHRNQSQVSEGLFVPVPRKGQNKWRCIYFPICKGFDPGVSWFEWRGRQNLPDWNFPAFLERKIFQDRQIPPRPDKKRVIGHCRFLPKNTDRKVSRSFLWQKKNVSFSGLSAAKRGSAKGCTVAQKLLHGWIVFSLSNV